MPYTYQCVLCGGKVNSTSGNKERMSCPHCGCEGGANFEATGYQQLNIKPVPMETLNAIVGMGDKKGKQKNQKMADKMRSTDGFRKAG